MGRPRSKLKCPECGHAAISPTLLGAHRWAVHKVPGKSSNSKKMLEERRRRLGTFLPEPKKPGKPRVIPSSQGLERASMGLADAIASLRLHVVAYQDAIRVLEELIGQDREELSRG